MGLPRTQNIVESRFQRTQYDGTLDFPTSAFHLGDAEVFTESRWEVWTANLKQVSVRAILVTENGKKTDVDSLLTCVQGTAYLPSIHPELNTYTVLYLCSMMFVVRLGASSSPPDLSITENVKLGHTAKDPPNFS